jgi:hypothetical protein
MDQEQEKYDKVVNMLRRSHPYTGDSKQFTEKVIRRISQERTSVSVSDFVYEFIFGWVFIGWMRRSMVTAAICLMLFFGYQQAVLMRKVDTLSSMSVVDGNVQQTGTVTVPDARVKIYTLFGKRAFERRMEMSEKKELDKFIESVNDLRMQYKNVLRMIETDPQLKKYVDDRLKKEETVKPKI